LLHVDARTDGHMTKPTVAFRNFRNTPLTTIIIHALYGCLTRYFALREERKSRTFENMALRRTSEPNSNPRIGIPV